MNRLEYFTTQLVLANAASSLPLPPSSAIAMVPSDGTWGNGQMALVPEFELEIWGTVAVAMTDSMLYGARQRPFVYADATVTFNAGTDLLTKSGHGLLTGDGPFFFTTTTTLPPELTAATVGYYFVKVDANTGKLATSLGNALAGVTIDLTGAGSGTITISDSDLTKRLVWATHDGLLGLDEDGAIAITASTGYSKRIPHSPRVVAYALVATLDTGAVSATLTPISRR